MKNKTYNFMNSKNSKYLTCFSSIYLMFFWIQFTYAQPGSNDSTFNTFDDGSFVAGTSFNGGVFDCSVQNDGKIIVGGSYFSYDDLIYFWRIARLNSNGTIDNSFSIGTGFNDIVWAIAIQQDGKILVGGQFTEYNGIAANRLIRLNIDGSIDNSFNSSFDQIVRHISLQQDGKIILTGNFTSCNGVSRNRIARINTNGTIDNSFNPGTGFNTTALQSKIQSDGKIVVVGEFISFNGTTSNRAIRLNTDGTRDATFNIGSGFNGILNSLEIQSDGKIIFGGDFTSINNVFVGKIVRLNPNGTLDNQFNTGLGFSGGGVTELKLQSDGKIIIGGVFSQYNGIPFRGIIRLNFDGTIDSNFSIGSGINSNAAINSINILDDGKIIIGGSFSTYNNFSRRYFAKLNSNGTLDGNFKTGSGFFGQVNSITTQIDGKILVGGNFISYNGIQSNYFIRLNIDGTTDNSYNIGQGFDKFVNSITIQSDGKTIIGGDFNFYNSTVANRLVRLNSDGTIDNSFNIGSGFNGEVKDVKIQTDGKVLVGGNFTTFNGNNINRLVRLNSDGSIDLTFNINSGFNDVVKSLIIQTDGKIIVGGAFTSFSNGTKNRIVRLNQNGIEDNTFVIGTGFDNSVNAMDLQTDGKIIIVGEFTYYNASLSNRIIRLNTNGSKDQNFIVGVGFNNKVNTVALQNDGKIIIGGEFSTFFNGLTRNRIIRLNTNGNEDNTFLIGSGFNSSVLAIAIQSDSKILVGGLFTSYGSIVRNKIARVLGVCINPPSPIGLSSQSFCNSANISNLIVSGNNIQWYSTAVGGNPLPSNSILNNGQIYYASQTQSNCESQDRLGVTVTINNTSVPTGTTNQTYCNTATISNLSAIGTNIQWYNLAAGGTALSSSTVLVNGQAYYASQTVNGCESTERLAVTVTILAPSSPSGTSSQTFCNAATVNNLSATGTSIQWYNNASGGTALAASTALVNGQTYYATQTENNCESQQRLAVSVTINSPAAPTGNATQVFCSGSVVSDLTANGTNLKWYSTPSDGVSLPINSILMDGAIYYGSQTINNCESQNRFAVNVNLTPLPSNIVQQNNYTLIADQQGATYQWIHCNNGFQIIPNENQISYTPITGGSYAVQVTLNGCTNTSECITAITANLNENEDSFIINLYPNPNSGTFTFETKLTGKYLVMNNLGQIIAEFNVEYPSQKEVNLDKPSKGVYYIKHTENQARPTKLIVH